MNESQYKWLCNFCNNIIFEKNIYFIPWLNVIREHPIFLKNYENIFKKKSFISYQSHLQYNKFKYIVWWTIHLASCIPLKKKNKSLVIKKNQIKNLDYLFISHKLINDLSNSDDDFYFGSVPHDLVKIGYKVKILAINHAPKNKKIYISRFYELLDKKTNFSSEIAIHSKLKKQSNRIKKILITTKGILAKRILQKSSIEAMAPSAHFVGRMEVQIKRYIEQYKPDVLITTFEGHSWEKIVFATAKKINPNITCIGYQHSHHFRLQNGIRFMKDTNLNPDIIFTSGSNGKKYCEKIFQNLPILNVGTRRVQISNSIAKQTLAFKDKVCLVVPEGIIDECIKMFNYSILCAIKNPSVQFIFRLHPLISLNQLISRSSIYKNMPSNVSFSNNSLIDDAKKSKWALYRGSTAIIEICKEEVMPIYLETKGELSIDPLFNVNKLKTNVTNVNDFVNIISCDKPKNINKIIEYCDTLFSKLDISSFKKNKIKEILRNYD